MPYSDVAPTSENSVRHTLIVDPPEEDKNWNGVIWRWPSLLLVRLSPTTQNSDLRSSLLAIAPDRAGLKALDELDEKIESMWLLQPPARDDGPLRTEKVSSVAPWHAATTRERRTTALHCASGAIFIIDDTGDSIVEELPCNWSKGTKYKTL